MDKATQPHHSLVVRIIEDRLREAGGAALVPYLRGDGAFQVELVRDGVRVSNLGNQPSLPWAVFEETVSLLIKLGGRAQKGNAMGPRLGDPGLPTDSVEGHVASVVYGKVTGDSVFRRITPIAATLVWAGICSSDDGELVLTLGLPTNNRHMK